MDIDFRIQVVGIREALEEEFPEDESNTAGQIPCPPAQTFDIVLFGSFSCAINPNITEEPAEPLVYALLSTYLQRFDPIFKVMHTQSLRTLMLAKQKEVAEPMVSPGWGALRFAIYFAAVCTLNEEECRDRFQENRGDISNKFRLATEVMLSRSNLQIARDFTVLQAFAIYLVRHPSAYRVMDWYLISVEFRPQDARAMDIEIYRFLLQAPSILARALASVSKILGSKILSSSKCVEGYGTLSVFSTCRQRSIEEVKQPLLIMAYWATRQCV